MLEYKVHIKTSESPLHVPAQFVFQTGSEAMDFARAAARAVNALDVYATNRAGERLAGYNYTCIHNT